MKATQLLNNLIWCNVKLTCILFSLGAWGNVVVHCASSRMVPGSIPGGVTGDFFCGSPQQNHVPWGRLSLWKWVPGISPGVKAASGYCWWPTTLVVPNVKKIRGRNLPGTPWATSACYRMIFTFTFFIVSISLKKHNLGRAYFRLLCALL